MFLLNGEANTQVIVRDLPNIVNYETLVAVFVSILFVGAFILSLSTVGSSSPHKNLKIRTYVASSLAIVAFISIMGYAVSYHIQAQSWEEEAADLLGVSVGQLKEANVFDAVNEGEIARLMLPEAYVYSSETKEYSLEEQVIMVDGNVLSLWKASDVPAKSS